MRILFFLHNISKTRHFDTVLTSLAERGHTVILAAEQRARSKPLNLPKNLTAVNRRLSTDLCGRGGRIELTACPVRRQDDWAHLAPALRRARDYLRYLDPRYGHADKLKGRAAAGAPEGWTAYLDAHPRLAKRWRTLGRLLAVAEQTIPSAADFEAFVLSEKPDLVLVTPLVDYGSYQTDYVKSAHRLGLPVGFLPFSWDNLTNRGLIRVQPDRMLVWNERQRQEAVDLHGMPDERVVTTGAPRFDPFFSMSPSTTRAAFADALGLAAERRLLLYVCSSPFVAPEEIDFVRRWIEAVRTSPEADIREAGILVRPHPAHLAQWEAVDLKEYSGVARWSSHQTMNADQGLYDSLFHADAVVGLNTSAMIEAGILGKPVHTIVTAEFAGGQEQTMHFGYLRAANGGLLHEATSFREHVEQLTRTVRRDANDRAREQRFVAQFVRPLGLEAPVTPVMVHEIERMAQIAKTPPTSAPLWHRPARWVLRTVVGPRIRQH